MEQFLIPNISINNNQNNKIVISFERAQPADLKNNFIVESEEKILLMDFSENFVFFADFCAFALIINFFICFSIF